MYLPNGELATVSLPKLRDYCLNPDHPHGKHKARVFASVLGFTAEDAAELRRILLVAARTQEVQIAAQDEFGQRYLLDVKLAGVREYVLVRSVWIVRPSEGIPHLVTCYVR